MILVFGNIVKNLKALVAWAGATINSNTTTTSTVVIDTLGCESEVEFIVHSGTITDGSYVLRIMQTDNADGVTGATEVPSYLYQDTFAATEDDTVQCVGARLSRRYCTLRLVSTGVTTGGVFKSAVALLMPKARP